MTDATNWQRFPVLIVGAGPVGLTLAIDLAQRGIRCLIIEKQASHGTLPKMERVNARTMEHLHRLGLAECVREAGYPEDLPMDVFVSESLVADPLVHHRQPSVKTLKELGAKVNDGSMPREPYQVISQYTLEPLLRAAAEKLQGLTVRFGCELMAFSQDADGVEATVRNDDGTAETVSAQYMVACDGGSSRIREALGIQLSGNPSLLRIYQALLRSESLFERLPRKGRHYHILDDNNTFLIVQDDCKHFTLHSVLHGDEDMGQRFEQAVGMDVDYETLFVGAWTMRAMLADSYGDRRVFIAGDAAHLMPPTAGLGMNTGVGDSIDLAWKLEAILQGWGGDELLNSYELERRPVGASNIAYSQARFDARQSWRAAVSAGTRNGSSLPQDLAQLVSDNEAQHGFMEGVELGYSYAGSPLIPGAPTQASRLTPEPGIMRRYEPSVAPGARLPHVWLDPGATSVDDIVPRSAFALLCMSGRGHVASSFEAAFAAEAVPLEIVDVSSADARAVYGVAYVLVRPDLHVVWSGESELAHPRQLVRQCVGMPS